MATLVTSRAWQLATYVWGNTRGEMNDEGELVERRCPVVEFGPLKAISLVDLLHVAIIVALTRFLNRFEMAEELIKRGRPARTCPHKGCSNA